MHQERSPRRVPVAVAALLGAVVLAGCGHAAQPPKTAGAEYAALGDSDSSGAGIAPLADARCARSKANYASLVAKDMRYRSFRDLSCGGATTKNLTQPQPATSNEPQLDAVGPRTRLVTLTIGLNDGQFSSALLYACLSSSASVTDPSPWCRTVLAVSQADTDQAIIEAADRVEDALRSIKKRAPHARVVLVGYPRFLPDSGSCPTRVPFVDAMLPRLRHAFEFVNEQWKDAARRAGADYVDTYALSKDHDVCAVDPWVNATQDGGGKAAPMHPFAAFHRAVADAIVAMLNAQ